MSKSNIGLGSIALFIFLIVITGNIVAGDFIETDREVLLTLKNFLEEKNPVNRGRYTDWNLQSRNPCDWPGISCTTNRGRVIGIDLSNNEITGDIFGNFSSLTQLSYLDLSTNTLSGIIPADLSRCQNLGYLNLSHNILTGNLNLTGLQNLKTLDVSVNRIDGGIQSTFGSICNNLVVANISANRFNGSIVNSFDKCYKLQYLDLSSNNFTGELWPGFASLLEFSASENNFIGALSPSYFPANCNLQVLDLSGNNVMGVVPGTLSNCRNLVILNLWGNKFTGEIPSEIGLISPLEGLFLGSNSFSREIPESLLNLTNLVFLDLSKNKFGGKMQDIFGKFRQLKYLVLHGNSYTGGIYTSGILNLRNVSRLDLSHNSFAGPLPLEISLMPSLKFLILADNQFNGSIPPEFGNMTHLQALDLSFNKLTGSIPWTFGDMTSLLWLMLANNALTGEIPREIGNCSSLLWLNLANNQLRGSFPVELINIGRNATATFELNRQDHTRIIAGSGECLSMKRWIPADYPPFKFAYTLLTRKSCRSLWDKLLKGYGLFPLCMSGSKMRTLQISGYVQLSGNQLSGQLPTDIGKFHSNISMLHLGDNKFYGKIPWEIGQLPLGIFNVSWNNFSGEIPTQLGNLTCLQTLDLSYNNLSGTFPTSLNNLDELGNFNISYNPYISGVLPSTGQLTTFGQDSYFGLPHLHFPNFMNNSGRQSTTNTGSNNKQKRSNVVFIVFLTLTMTFLICLVISLIVCTLVKNSDESQKHLLKNAKFQSDGSLSCSSTPWSSLEVKVIRLFKTAFTYTDILKATGNFSEDRVIGRGGYGTVYRGVLPDGRYVAVKKLQREGIEGEKEFRAEMEALSGNGFGWPHPNLVTLYGWCLDISEKILVYEYMEGGNLEDIVTDRTRLSWRRRLDIAIDVARALLFLHHECFPAIVHRDVKASNVLLDKNGNACVTDFGLARFVGDGDSHVSTMVAGTIGYVAPEYGQTWQATTKGDVYSFGVLAMELATARRAVDGAEECLVEWARRVMGNGKNGLSQSVIPVVLLGSGLAEGAHEMCELLKIGVKCTAETPQCRPNMKEVLAMLINVNGPSNYFGCEASPPSSYRNRD